MLLRLPFPNWSTTYVLYRNDIIQNLLLLEIDQQQADALVGHLVIDPSRAARIDYTCGLGWAEPYNIIVPKPQFQSRFFAFVRPFQPLVNPHLRMNNKNSLYSNLTPYIEMI